MIDEPTIIKAVQGLGLMGNDEGLIPAFGVYLANCYSEYYNDLSFGLVDEIVKATAPDMKVEAINLLKHAALACGVNTLGGILGSAEWEAIIEPMVETDRDKVLGLVAVTNALGWGFWELIELEPGKSAVFHAKHPYEANGYKAKYGQSPDGTCYMLQGVAAAIMELIFPREGREEYYHYEAIEPQCIAKGDPYCVFVVSTRDD